MIRFKFYRWLLVMAGSRSFIKTNDEGQISYGIVRGSGTKVKQMVDAFIEMDFVEEWPVTRGE